MHDQTVAPSHSWCKVVKPSSKVLTNQNFLPQFWILMRIPAEPDAEKRLKLCKKVVLINEFQVTYNSKVITFEQYLDNFTKLHQTYKLKVYPHGIVQAGNTVGVYLTYVRKHKRDGVRFVQRAMGWFKFNNENKAVELMSTVTEPQQVVPPSLTRTLTARALSCFRCKNRLHLNIPYADPKNGIAFDTNDELLAVFASMLSLNLSGSNDENYRSRIRTIFAENASVSFGPTLMNGVEEIGRKMFPLFAHLTEDKQLHGGIRLGRELTLYLSLVSVKSLTTDARKSTRIVYRSIARLAFAHDCDKIVSMKTIREAVEEKTISVPQNSG